MAREGRAVAGVVRRVVDGIDMRETGEVDQECTQQEGADGSRQASGLSGGGCS